MWFTLIIFLKIDKVFEFSNEDTQMSNNHLKLFKGKQIKATVENYFISINVCSKETILSDGKYVKILEPICITDGNLKLHRPSEKQFDSFSKKIYIEIPQDPEHPIQDINSRDLKYKIYSQDKLSTPNNIGKCS